MIGVDEVVGFFVYIYVDWIVFVCFYFKVLFGKGYK